MQSDRRFSSRGSGACQADSRAERCRAASALPSPVTLTASPALLRLLAAHSPCRELRTPGTHTPVTANTSSPLPNKAWLRRTCYSIILCGLLVWNTQLPQIRNLLPHGICFILFLLPLTFIFNGRVLDFCLETRKHGAEKMSKNPHFVGQWCGFIPSYRLFLSGLCIFFPWGVTGRSEAHKCSLPVYYSCKWVVKTQKCHLVSGRGGKQEPKLRSSTYHSTHFCHMKSKLSILGISETYLGSLDPSKSEYRKHLFSCIGVVLSSWCRFYFKSLF